MPDDMQAGRIPSPCRADCSDQLPPGPHVAYLFINLSAEPLMIAPMPKTGAQKVLESLLPHCSRGDCFRPTAPQGHAVFV